MHEDKGERFLNLNTTDQLDKAWYAAEKIKLCSEIQYPEYFQLKRMGI